MAVRSLVLLAAFALTASAIVLSLRERGRDAIARCDEALERGDVGAAVVLAKRAAQARVWGSPYPEQGYERLASIAREREASSDRDGARAAYRATLAAARSTGQRGGAHEREAARALAALDDRAPRLPEAPEGAPEEWEPVLRPWQTPLLGLSVLVAIAGGLWTARGGRLGWLVLGAGLGGALLASLG